MAKIYVSSTIADLSAERKAVIDWLVQARHQPVHSYLSDSESVRDSCLADIDGCDLYVLILGFRYGYQQSDENNPEGLSITHLEFRRAENKPRVALLATNIPNIDLTDLLDDKRKPLIMAFRDEVARMLRPAQFKDEATLIAALSAGVQAELDKLKPKGQTVAPDDPAVLAIIGKLTLEKQAADSENQLLHERINALETQLAAAVARTLTAAAQPDASPAAIIAAEALGEGDSRPAEALLRKEEARAQQEAITAPDASDDEAAARHRAAELAREQGALAFGRDVRTALAAYERAARHEPEDTWTHIYLGDLYRDFGDLAMALQSYDAARATAEKRVATGPDDDNALHDLAVCYERLGNVSLVQGNLAAALGYYKERHAIAEKLAARDVANNDWQRDLSVSYEKIGDVLVAQGDLAGALAAFRDDLAIAEKLAARDAANVQWQIDLAVSFGKLGTQAVLTREERQAYLKQGLAILKQLQDEGRLPPNQNWITWIEEELTEQDAAMEG